MPTKNRATTALVIRLAVLLAAPAFAQPAPAEAFAPAANPAFQLDYASPTADKPQSKLWYMDGCWWALLPRATGPSLWRRTDAGWREHSEVARALQGAPGRADVWPGEDGITAAAVTGLTKSNGAISVFRLVRQSESGTGHWEARVLAELSPPSPEDAIETATIARDAAGAWWVAAVAGVKVCVWAAPPDATAWSDPIVLAEGVDPDDIAAVTPLPDNQIGVLWSDQRREAFLKRAHNDGARPEDWEPEIAIQIGGKAADDHINTVLAPGGTLWAATKNEIDTDGQPQFTLHERIAGGAWRSWPYAVRTATTRPSRPIAVASADCPAILTGYGDSDRALPFPHNARIVFSRVNPEVPGRIEPPRTVIAPDPAHQSAIQNVTGPRHPFPPDAPWIVLASDPEGRVYEADLRGAFPELAQPNP
ncbi:MAG: hypothetical protein KF886_01240 [Candidatus Hydrogenedentes bacterium]|nr:hypothetical protein [Candidatus Hydrogenedentota bacterium]